MRTLIRKCNKCSYYTMKETCPRCGSKTAYALPERYSPKDRFQRFRLKELEVNESGKNTGQ